METYMKTNETHMISDPSVETVDTDKYVENVNDKNKKYFACDIGGQKQLLNKKHIHKHMKEKPSSSAVCNKEFPQKSNLNVHYRTHTKEKPYSCDVCHTDFSQKCELKRHYRIHTNEKPYSCDVCNKEFSHK
ncbi:Gastrula zinc finger protein xFG20-1, partial [Araneus ventricosus]